MEVSDTTLRELKGEHLKLKHSKASNVLSHICI